VSVSPARDAPKVWICCKLQHLFKKINKKEKERKSEIEQNIWFLPVKMPKVSKWHQSVEKKE